MRRREFIAGIGGEAAWPLMTRAQGPVLPRDIYKPHSNTPVPTVSAFN